MARIVVALSSGLDPSIAIAWLKEQYRAEVVAVTMDLGQDQPLESVRDRALAAGAARAHVLDLREEFARSYVLPALKAEALSAGPHPRATALGRSLIARTLVDLARIERATLVAHGGTGADDELAGFDVTIRALDPGLTVIVPARDWGMTPLEAIESAPRRGTPVPMAPASPHQADTILWGRSIACGMPGEPRRWLPPESRPEPTKAARWPFEPAYAELAFERGVPVAVNGVAMPLLDLIASLTTLAGAHGIGRLETPGALYPAPAAAALQTAHRELQSLVTARDLNRFARLIGIHYAHLIDSGLWFTPLREALDGFVEEVQDRVTGAVRLQLFHGDCRVVSRQSPYALSDNALASSDFGVAIDRGAAIAFLRTYGLPEELAALETPGARKPFLVTT